MGVRQRGHGNAWRVRVLLLSGNLYPVSTKNFGPAPVFQIPTISNKSLGSNVWGGGPTAAVVYMTGPWVAGALVNDL
jgi:hypothetical protein